MYTLGGDPLAQANVGDNTYVKKVTGIIQQNESQSPIQKNAAKYTGSNSIYNINYPRWASIIIGLILFAAGVFMLTHQTKIVLQK